VSVPDPRDPPSAPPPLAEALPVSASDDESPLPRLGVFVPLLGVGLGLFLLVLAVAPIRRLRVPLPAVVPIRRLGGMSGGVAVPRGPMAVAVVVVVNSVLIGILIAQLGR
jgi:hypothetical protein